MAMSESVIRRFIDFPLLRVDWEALVLNGVTWYEAGKLALNLLPILLSRIKSLGQLEAQAVAVFLRRYPPFNLLENDRLEPEKIKAAQAIQEFLEV